MEEEYTTLNELLVEMADDMFDDIEYDDGSDFGIEIDYTTQS